jgi:hypothetical protein
MDLIIRPENSTETRLVEELTREAFWDIHVPGCNEYFLLHNLRKSKDFISELNLVAEFTGRVVGHIAYTRAAGRFLKSSDFAINPATFELFDRTFPLKEKHSGTPSQLEFSIMSSLRY